MLKPIDKKTFVTARTLDSRGQDAVSRGEDPLRIAVADGVTSGAVAQFLFASFLVEEFCRGPLRQGVFDDVAQWSGSLLVKWRTTFNDRYRQPHMRLEAVNNDYLRGWDRGYLSAAATFAGCEIDFPPDAKGAVIKYLAVGDAYLFVVEDGREVRRVTEDSGKTDLTHAVVMGRTSEKGFRSKDIGRIELDGDHDAVVMVTTDKIGRWISDHVSRGEHDFVLSLLDCKTDLDFLAWVDQGRLKDKRIDDVSVAWVCLKSEANADHDRMVLRPLATDFAPQPSDLQVVAPSHPNDPKLSQQIAAAFNETSDLREKLFDADETHAVTAIVRRNGRSTPIAPLEIQNTPMPARSNGTSESIDDASRAEPQSMDGEDESPPVRRRGIVRRMARRFLNLISDPGKPRAVPNCDAERTAAPSQHAEKWSDIMTKLKEVLNSLEAFEGEWTRNSTEKPKASRAVTRDD